MKTTVGVYFLMISILLQVHAVSAMHGAEIDWEKLAKKSDDVFQYKATLEIGKDPKGNKRTTNAYMFIPGGCRAVRGMVLAQHGVAEMAFCENAAVRFACGRNDLAIVYFFPSFSPGFEHPNEDGKVLFSALDALAAVSGYEEIRSAPWISFGHSGCGSFARNIATWMPDRTIGVLNFKSAPDVANPRLHAIPIVNMGNANVEWNQTKSVNLRLIGNGLQGMRWLLKERKAVDRPLLDIVECGSSHFDLSPVEAAFLAQFIDKVSSRRLPKAPGDHLEPVAMDRGWSVAVDLTDPLKPGFSKPFPVAEDRDRARQGFWFFDEEMAYAWLRITDVNWAREPQWPILKYADGTPVEFGSRGPMEAQGKWAADGSLALEPALMTEIPRNFSIDPGVQIMNSGLRVGVRNIAGCRMREDGRIEPILDRRLFWPGTVVTAYVPGNDQYRPAVQVVAGIEILSWIKSGKPQTVVFPEIPDCDLSTKEIKLAGSSSMGLPVQYVVIHGPATWAGGNLQIGPVPPRSKFPIEIDVMAYSFGRHGPGVDEVALSNWVHRKFKIVK